MNKDKRSVREKAENGRNRKMIFVAFFVWNFFIKVEKARVKKKTKTKHYQCFRIQQNKLLRFVDLQIVRKSN